MTACRDLPPEVGDVAACESLGVARATYCRWLEPVEVTVVRPRGRSESTVSEGRIAPRR